MAGFDAIKTEVKARLGNRTDIDARLVTWINDAYFELLLSPRFSFYELDKEVTAAMVASQKSYTLPTDIWFILSLRDTTNGREIDRRHWQEFDRTTPTNGQPTKYARFGNAVELEPTPDAVYNMNLRYRIRPAELSAGGSHLLGREWDEVLTILSVAKGAEALKDRKLASEQRSLLEPLMSIRLDVPQLEDRGGDIKPVLE